MPLSILSGILYALCFPKFDLGPFLGWVCFWPLFSCLSKAPHWRAAFIKSFWAGLTASGIVLYWVIVTVHAGGGGLIASVAAWLAFAGVLGIFWGLFGVLSRPWITRQSPMSGLIIAALWVSCEYLRCAPWTILGGFPWCLMGHAWTGVTPLMQIAEIGGVPLAGFLIIFTQFESWRAIHPSTPNTKFVIGSNDPLTQPSPSRGEGWGVGKNMGKRLSPLIVVAFLLSAAGAFGWIRLSQLRPKLVSMSQVAIAQGNINQYEKWDPSRVSEIISVYRGLARLPKVSESKVIILPESSFPMVLNSQDNSAPTADEAVRLRRLLGFDGPTSYVVGTVARGKVGYVNGALVLRPDGSTGWDAKVHLVPFGEFVPFEPVVSALVKMTGSGDALLNSVGGFIPGPQKKTLDLGAGLKAGISICYEAIFPEFSRNDRAAGANLLVNLTNDGWYLDTAAPYQHFQAVLWRSIETRLPLVRAANTGISAVINPLGLITAKSKLNEKVLLNGKLEGLISPTSPAWPVTQAAFPYICIVATVVGILMTMPIPQNPSKLFWEKLRRTKLEFFGADEGGAFLT